MSESKTTGRLLLTMLVIWTMFSLPRGVSGQDTSGNALDELRFSFDRTPWRGVIQWLAESADLALHVGDPPPGSFTYSDSRVYTPDEAMNRINMFLIPQRYTLVRSGNLLSVINMDDSTSLRQLDAMAPMIKITDLALRGEHEFVKCLFPLGDIAAPLAVDELSGLMLASDPTILTNTNQLLVMGTVKKLRTVDEILQRMATPEIIRGPVKRFDLGDLDPDQVLAQVRPHVGLDPLAMTGPDINMSVDAERRQLLASGSSQNLQAVANVLQLINETEPPAESEGIHQFQPHDVGQADMQTVVSVLQTLLADEDVRMAPDTKSNQIVILALPHVHELVSGAIRDLSGKADPVEFKSISVQGIDPRYAAVVLNRMFTTSTDGDGPEQEDPPLIEVNATDGRLLVRGKTSQIEKIEEALKQLAPEVAAKSDATLRMLPYKGDHLPGLLQQAKEFWPFKEPLHIIPSGQRDPGEALEREINAGEGPEATLLPQSHRTRLAGSSAPASGSVSTSGAIRVLLTPRGLLVRSDDPEAIDRFAAHLELIAGPPQGDLRRLAIFYLKHTTVSQADTLLRQLLDEEDYSKSLLPFSTAGLGSPIDQTLSNVLRVEGLSGGPLDQMWSLGTATVIPDSRLNRMFVYADPVDLEMIQNHLRAIDREDSIAEIKTHGTPRTIQLEHARAEVVADAIRDAYAGRIAANTKERLAAAAAQRQRQDESRNNRSSSPPGNAQPQRPSPAAIAPSDSELPMMTLAVDPPSNSLIVTAPKKLADEVEALAKDLDHKGTQAVQVHSIVGTSAGDVHDVLRSLFGTRIQSGSRQRSPSSGTR